MAVAVIIILALFVLAMVYSEVKYKKWFKELKENESCQLTHQPNELREQRKRKKSSVKRKKRVKPKSVKSGVRHRLRPGMSFVVYCGANPYAHKTASWPKTTCKNCLRSKVEHDIYRALKPPKL